MPAFMRAFLSEISPSGEISYYTKKTHKPKFVGFDKFQNIISLRTEELYELL